MGWTARIAQLSSEPAKAVLQQGDRLMATFCGLAVAGIIGGQKMHQSCADLLGSSAGTLVFEGMPITITDAQ